MARRGYRRRLSTPVVEGTGVDLAQACQGSYAPARAGVAEPVQARANKCSTAARAFFPKKPHPQGQRAE
jgi:hypothetical protein